MPDWWASNGAEENTKSTSSRDKKTAETTGVLFSEEETLIWTMMQCNGRWRKLQHSGAAIFSQQKDADMSLILRYVIKGRKLPG